MYVLMFNVHVAGKQAMLQGTAEYNKATSSAYNSLGAKRLCSKYQERRICVYVNTRNKDSS